MKTKTFKTEMDGKEVTLVVKSPTPHQLSDAKLVGIKAATKAIKDKALSRAQILDYLRDMGSWNDEKQEQLQELTEKIRDGERQLKRGGKTSDGKKFTKTQARELCFNMQGWRAEQLNLLSDQRKLDEYTVEGCAENAQFDYLVSVCSYNEEGNNVFSSVDDYIDKSRETYAIQCAFELSSLIYGLDDNFEKNKPENKFLVQHGFAREDLRLINSKGQLIDREGRLINEDGRFIDEEGNLVDRSGNRVDQEGNPVEEFTEFED